MINGQDASIEDFPYMALIKCKQKGHNDDSYEGEICGGSILSPWHILTAAHCFDDMEKCKVVVGSTLRDGSDGGQVLDAATWNQHESYVRELYMKNGNDIAVLKLASRIELDGKTRKTIDLWKYNKIKAGTNATVAGWGWTNPSRPPYSRRLKYLNMKIVHKDQCRQTLLSLTLQKILLHRQVCAISSDDDPTKSICRGDSGSPLVIDGQVSGVVSFSDYWCSTVNFPNIFTEVSPFRRWILRKLDEL